MRIACDSRTGVRRLRSALAEHVNADPDVAPLGFVLTTAPGFWRHHQLVDRSGSVLSRGRGLDAGLHALASHLTALVAPVPGTVRVRARTVVNGDRAAAVFLSPLLFVPTLDESDLKQVGCQLVDRLAIDLEVATGAIVNGEIPWAGFRELSAGTAHAEPGGRLAAMAVIDARPAESPPPTTADIVARMAGGALHGRPEDVLDAVIRLVTAAEVRSIPPEQAALTELLRELNRR